MKTTAVIVAAGMGRRMGADTTKQLIEIGGKPILWHTLLAFQKISQVDEVILVVRDEEMTFIKEEIIEAAGISKVSKVVAGGNERADSVANGVAAVTDSQIIMIHDGARPFIEETEINRLMDAMERWDAAVLGIPAKDTIKQVDDQGIIRNTLVRSELWQVQTPQCFKAEVLKKALKAKGQIASTIYDDAMLVEKGTGSLVKMVMGSDKNIKITTPFDLVIGEGIYRLNKGDKNV